MSDGFSWSAFHAPAGPAQPSGSTAPPEPPVPAGRFARLRSWRQDVSWFDIIAVVLAILVWDFVSALGLSGYFAIRCGGEVCTLHQNLHRDEMLFWLIPLVMVLPPTLVALWKRRMRSLVIGFQLIVLAALMIHTGYDAHLQQQRIDGTVPCWNKLYPPKECPWGTQ